MDFSKITDALYIGTTPDTQDYHTLRQLGVALVINMRVERRPRPDLHNPPIPIIWLPSFDMPLAPIPLGHIKRGVAAALTTIEKGGNVYSHCAKGVHRSVAMGAAILIALGHSPEGAMELIKQQRGIASPHTWYIRRRIEHFAASWNHWQPLSPSTQIS